VIDLSVVVVVVAMTVAVKGITTQGHTSMVEMKGEDAVEAGAGVEIGIMEVEVEIETGMEEEEEDVTDLLPLFFHIKKEMSIGIMIEIEEEMIGKREKQEEEVGLSYHHPLKI